MIKQILRVEVVYIDKTLDVESEEERFSVVHFSATPERMTSCAKESHLFKHMDCETLFNPLIIYIYPHDNVVACKQKYKIPLIKDHIIWSM